MAHYLLSWNQHTWHWEQYSLYIQGKLKLPFTREWTIQTTSIKRGDKVFLMMRGVDSKHNGIIGYGTVVSDIYTVEENYNILKKVNVEFSQLLDFQKYSVLELHDLQIEFPKQTWATTTTFTRIVEDIVERLLSIWESFYIEITTQSDEQHQSVTISEPAGKDSIIALSILRLLLTKKKFSIEELMKEFKLEQKELFFYIAEINDRFEKDNIGQIEINLAGKIFLNYISTQIKEGKIRRYLKSFESTKINDNIGPEIDVSQGRLCSVFPESQLRIFKDIVFHRNTTLKEMTNRVGLARRDKAVIELENLDKNIKKYNLGKLVYTQDNGLLIELNFSESEEIYRLVNFDYSFDNGKLDRNVEDIFHDEFDYNILNSIVIDRSVSIHELAKRLNSTPKTILDRIELMNVGLKYRDISRCVIDKGIVSRTDDYNDTHKIYELFRSYHNKRRNEENETQVNEIDITKSNPEIEVSTGQIEESRYSDVVKDIMDEIFG